MGKAALSGAAQRFPWRTFPFPSTRVRPLQPRSPKDRGFFLAWRPADVPVENIALSTAAARAAGDAAA